MSSIICDCLSTSMIHCFNMIILYLIMLHATKRVKPQVLMSVSSTANFARICLFVIILLPKHASKFFLWKFFDPSESFKTCVSTQQLCALIPLFLFLGLIFEDARYHLYLLNFVHYSSKCWLLKTLTKILNICYKSWVLSMYYFLRRFTWWMFLVRPSGLVYCVQVLALNGCYLNLYVLNMFSNSDVFRVACCSFVSVNPQPLWTFG